MQRFFCHAQDPVSCGTHAIGAVAAGIGAFVMLVRAVLAGATTIALAAAMCFCLSMVALYSASAVYHFYPGDVHTGGVKQRLRKMDHSMIYVLIAGSYTPIVLKYMQAPGAYLFLMVIWGIALFGIAVKLVWIDAPRFLGTILYLLMGWAVIFRFDVVLSMPAPAITLLAIGGLSYTIGGVIYILKKPNLSEVLGFHELFHLFVLAGSVAHYLMVFWFVL